MNTVESARASPKTKDETSLDPKDIYESGNVTGVKSASLINKQMEMRDRQEDTQRSSLTD